MKVKSDYLSFKQSTMFQKYFIPNKGWATVPLFKFHLIREHPVSGLTGKTFGPSQSPHVSASIPSSNNQGGVSGVLSVEIMELDNETMLHWSSDTMLGVKVDLGCSKER